MQNSRKNSFRCFAIFQIGMADQDGKFLTIHKRGCLKTFNNEKAALIKAVNYHYDGQTKQHSQDKDRFEFNNWIGIKQKKGDDTYYFLLLCHQIARKEDAYEKLQMIKTWINNNFLNIDPNELEDHIKKAEEKYQTFGEGDGFKTDEDEDEKVRNLNIQQQQQYQQSQQQQYQQSQQQQLLLQSKPQLRSSYQNEKIAQRSLSPINKIDYKNIISIIDKQQDVKPKINGTKVIQVNVSNQPSNLNYNERSIINQQQKPESSIVAKKRVKSQFSDSQAHKQMNESNKIKQADSLIRNSIVGAIATGTLALIL